MLQNAIGKMGIRSENISEKTIMMQEADEVVAEYYSKILQLSHFALVKKNSLAHYGVTSKREKPIFRSSPFM